jgi:hypothetical protein
VSAPHLPFAKLTGRVSTEKVPLIKLALKMSGLYIPLRTQASICILVKVIRGRYYCTVGIIIQSFQGRYKGRQVYKSSRKS